MSEKRRSVSMGEKREPSGATSTSPPSIAAPAIQSAAVLTPSSCHHNRTMNARCACGVVHLIPLYEPTENSDLRKEIDQLRAKIHQDAHEARILNEYSLKLERELKLKDVLIEEERNASAQQLSSSKMEVHSLKVENEVLRKHITVLEAKISTRPSPDRHSSPEAAAAADKTSHVALEVLLKNITYENTNLRKLLGHKESVINYLTNLPPSEGSRSNSVAPPAGGMRSGSVTSTSLTTEAVEAALTRHHLVDQANQKQLLFEALARVHCIVNAGAVRRHRCNGDEDCTRFGQEFRKEIESVFSSLGLSLEVSMPLECNSLVLLPSSQKKGPIAVRSVAVPAGVLPAPSPSPVVAVRRLRNSPSQAQPPASVPSTAAATKSTNPSLRQRHAQSARSNQQQQQPCKAFANQSTRQQRSPPTTSIDSEISRLREERLRMEKQNEELTLQLYSGGTVVRKSPFRSRSLDSRHSHPSSR